MVSGDGNSLRTTSIVVNPLSPRIKHIKYLPDAKVKTINLTIILSTVDGNVSIGRVIVVHSGRQVAVHVSIPINQRPVVGRVGLLFPSVNNETDFVSAGTAVICCA